MNGTAEQSYLSMLHTTILYVAILKMEAQLYYRCQKWNWY